MNASAASSLRVFVQTVPGLEPLLAEELGELGFVGPLQADLGGVELRTDVSGLFRLALASELAESLRLRLKSFVARDFHKLEAELARLPWRGYFEPGAALRIQVVCHKSKLWHSDAVKERVARVLSEQAGLCPLPEGASPEERERAQLLHLRLVQDEVFVSVDASGAHHHRRGYRSRVERASLRETLAAALWRQARKRRAWGAAPELIWDPFCGAGTLLLEAARREAGLLPGAFRSFPLEGFRVFRQFDFAEERRRLLHASAERAQEAKAELRFWGTELSASAVAAARFNAARLAQLAEELLPGLHLPALSFEQSRLKALGRGPESSFSLLSNPPYGARLEETQALAELSRLLVARPEAGPHFLWLGGPALKRGLRGFSSALRTQNGGLSIELLERAVL